MANRYWAVSLHPSGKAHQQSVDTSLYRFNIPNLRVGTLDSLLALSYDLSKSNNLIEGVSHKILRQMEELERVSGVVTSSLTVDGVPVDSYLTRFVWDEAKYPTMSPLLMEFMHKLPRLRMISRYILQPGVELIINDQRLLPSI